jgi:hypothetical protein
MMKRAFLSIAIILFTAQAFATEIETQAQADAFLDNYCIALINEVAKAVKRQDAHSVKNEWQQVGEQGTYIAGVADVYSKLCRKRDKGT